MNHGTEAAERFSFLDGMRGLAALWVVFLHAYTGSLQPVLDQFSPNVLRPFCLAGYLGVPVFFVLSGFVVAYILRATWPNPREAGHFLLRRQLRLGPAYWLVVGLVALDAWLPNLLLHRDNAVPSGWQLLTHFAYLQNLVSDGDMLQVFWTLCLEMQFYVVFVLLLLLAAGLARWLGDRRAGGIPGGWLLLVFAPLFLASLAAPSVGSGTSTWFLGHWYMFALGTATFWVWDRRLPPAVLHAAWVLALCVSVVEGGPAALTAVLTSLAIHLAAEFDQLGRRCGGRALQYLGRISYSLYLVHCLVTHRLMNLSRASGVESPWAALTLLVFAVACSVVAAHFLYTWVEAPSIRWAAKLKHRRRGPAPPTEVSGEPGWISTAVEPSPRVAQVTLPG